MYPNNHRHWQPNNQQQQRAMTPADQVGLFLEELGHAGMNTYNEMMEMLSYMPIENAFDLLNEIANLRMNNIQQVNYVRIQLNKMMGGQQHQQQHIFASQGGQMAPQAFGGTNPDIGGTALLGSGFPMRSNTSNAGMENTNRNHRFSSKSIEEETPVEEDNSAEKDQVKQPANMVLNSSCPTFDVAFTVDDVKKMPKALRHNIRRIKTDDAVDIEGLDTVIIQEGDILKIPGYLKATLLENNERIRDITIVRMENFYNSIFADNRIELRDLFASDRIIEDLSKAVANETNRNNYKLLEVLVRNLTDEVNFLLRTLDIVSNITIENIVDDAPELLSIIQQNDDSHPEKVRLLKDRLSDYVSSIGVSYDEEAETTSIFENLNIISINYFDREVDLNKMERGRPYCIGLSVNNAFLLSLSMYVNRAMRNYIVTESNSVFRISVEGDSTYIERLT